MTANYPKRITEQTARIRKIAASLPVFQRHALLNACGRIEHTARRQNAYPSPMEQHDAIRDRALATKRIVAALLAGEVLSFHDGPRFGTSEFHTRIVDARRYIERHYPELVFAQEWAENHKYMTYWVTAK